MKRGAGVILIKNGKTLLTRAREKSGQITGTISFPGGHIDSNETEEQAAGREFTEETGLIAKDLISFPDNYVEDKLVLKYGTFDFSFRVFIAENYSGELKTTEETEPFWVDIETARKIKLLGKDNELLENAIKFLETNQGL